MQHYEPAMLDRWPRDYVIVQHGNLTTRVQEVDSDGFSQTVYVPGDSLPNSWSLTLTRGFKYGQWTGYAAAPIYRLLGSKMTYKISEKHRIRGSFRRVIPKNNRSKRRPFALH